MLKAATLIALLTILSKILGLIRDLIIAHYFGTSIQADAFNLAYMFTGNFFIILGCVGGPFYSSIVATLPKIQNSGTTTWHFLKDILAKTFLISVLICLGIYFFKNLLLTKFINPQSEAEYFNLTLINIDILLPLIIICGPIGIIYGILNCYKKFAEPSFSPAIVSIVSIITICLMGDSINGLAMAIGTSLGGLASLATQIPSLIKIKKEIKKSFVNFDWIKIKKEYYQILFPSLLATAASQIMVFVDGYFCNGLEAGSWTALVLANRLIQMPLGILLTAFLVPVFPRLTEFINQKNFTQARKLFSKSTGLLVLLCIPAVLIGIFWSKFLIKLVFEHGAFDTRSTEMVSSTFYYLCFSVIPYVLRDSFTRALYSFGDSKSAFYVTFLAILIKFGLNYFLVPIYGLNGIAIATSLISLINALILLFILLHNYKKSGL